MGGDAKQESADERLAANMRALRESGGISQTALAQAMADRGWPWHQSTVYRVESGRQAVHFGEAAALAEILGVPLDRLSLASPETDAMETLLRRSSVLRQASLDVTRTVYELTEAREQAEETLAETEDAPWPRIRELRDVLAGRLAGCTLDESIAEAARFYEERNAGKDGEDVDSGPDEERQPGIVDQH